MKELSLGVGDSVRVSVPDTDIVITVSHHESGPHKGATFMVSGELIQFITHFENVPKDQRFYLASSGTGGAKRIERASSISRLGFGVGSVVEVVTDP